jgi:hypothetical protein
MLYTLASPRRAFNRPRLSRHYWRPAVATVTKAASISGHSIPSGMTRSIGLPPIAPGGAERAEERHVRLIEALGAGELSASAIDGPAAGRSPPVVSVGGVGAWIADSNRLR